MSTQSLLRFFFFFQSQECTEKRMRHMPRVREWNRQHGCVIGGLFLGLAWPCFSWEPYGPTQGHCYHFCLFSTREISILLLTLCLTMYVRLAIVVSVVLTHWVCLAGVLRDLIMYLQEFKAINTLLAGKPFPFLI